MSEEKKDSEVRLKPDEFKQLEKLNNRALRAAQDAEVVVQQAKLSLLLAQKEARDCFYQLCEHYGVDPNKEYTLNASLQALVLKG